MKILLTGGSGLFGRAFVELVKDKASHDIYATYNENIVDSEDAVFLDITDKEIVDAIQWLVDHGYRVKSAFVQGWWKDTGKPEDIIHANRLVLDEIKETKNFGALENAKINGRVIIEENAAIENSTIKGPAVIGKNCKVMNSYIGPYTSIGNNCEIANAEIEDSVVMEETKINGIKRIVESLIGRGVEIIKNDGLPEGHKLVIGDNSEVKI